MEDPATLNPVTIFLQDLSSDGENMTNIAFLKIISPVTPYDFKLHVGFPDIQSVFDIPKDIPFQQYDIGLTRYLVACGYDYDHVDTCKTYTNIILDECSKIKELSKQEPVHWEIDEHAKMITMHFKLKSTVNSTDSDIWLYSKNTLQVPETRVVTRDGCFLSRPATHEKPEDLVNWFRNELTNSLKYLQYTR